MQLKLITLLAFASEALGAATESNPSTAPPATTPAPAQGDLLRVLLTALPPSLLNIALTNQPAVSSIIASEFAAGITEPWFKSLPTPVQQYLVNQGKQGSAAVPTSLAPGGAPFTNVSTPSATMRTSPMTKSPTKTSGSITVPVTSTFTASETGTSSFVNTPETTPASNQTSSTAGAMPMPLPTAAIGAGIAGAIGIMGLMGF